LQAPTLRLALARLGEGIIVIGYTAVGGVAERFNALVLKMSDREVRGFESLPLRHNWNLIEIVASVLR
jgi:hypothetical protein